MQNCNLNFIKWVKLVHSCEFKYTFTKDYLVKEEGPEITCVPWASHQVNRAFQELENSQEVWNHCILDHDI